MLRTGYDYVIGNRTTDMFAVMAKQDGVVKSVNKHAIVVEYKDGKTKAVSLGRQFGKAEGSVYPHDVVTPLKEGDKFVKGDCIAYNTGFFEQDFLDPSKIVMKTAVMARVALMESPLTHEDSSAISSSLADKLTTKTTKVKSFTINFQQEVRNVVKVGDKVTPTSVLLLIEDEITSGTGTFNEQDLEVLTRLSKLAPKAKYHGTIDKIEVLYNGDKEDMSVSLRSLVEQSDKELATQCKSSGKPVVNGRVNSDYRVKGTPLTLDKAEIKIYLTVSNSPGVGDKAVFGLQLKSTHAATFGYRITDENGEAVDAIFGARSCANRIVESPYLIGTTSTLLKVFAKKMIEAYRK